MSSQTFALVGIITKNYASELYMAKGSSQLAGTASKTEMRLKELLRPSDCRKALKVVAIFYLEPD